MKRNRRNLYRILHVQPEAPVEVIRASYQTLVAILGMRPGKGGDPETAELINEAWAVLGDPAKRVAYDKSLRLAIHRQEIEGHPSDPGQGLTKPARAAAAPDLQAKPPVSGKPGVPVVASGCPFCSRPLPSKIGRDTRCGGCSSPLAPVSPPERKNKDLLDRRGVLRIENELAITVYATAQGGPLPARLKDVSANGASLVVSNALQEGQVVRMVTRDFDALAMVVSVRRKGEQWAVGLRLLTWLVIR
ncbi:MAG: DnaJ domain-containing protein [Rhodoferax sp.]|nr:DnaJ domain-containing protein [Rhodoferax sp.]